MVIEPTSGLADVPTLCAMVGAYPVIANVPTVGLTAIGWLTAGAYPVMATFPTAGNMD